MGEIRKQFVDPTFKSRLNSFLNTDTCFGAVVNTGSNSISAQLPSGARKAQVLNCAGGVHITGSWTTNLACRSQQHFSLKDRSWQASRVSLPVCLPKSVHLLQARWIGLAVAVLSCSDKNEQIRHKSGVRERISSRCPEFNS